MRESSDACPIITVPASSLTTGLTSYVEIGLIVESRREMLIGDSNVCIVGDRFISDDF